jgi:methionyl-tRNA formyltransferase
MRRTPVHSAADSLGVPVFTPSSLRNIEVQNAFNTLAADVVVVAAYGLILPISILTAPTLGCLNLHASLLPRWRGAAPIQRAIMAGDLQTGIDVMRMDAGLDTGPIAMREIVPVRPDETAGDLTSRLAAIAAKMSVYALQSMEASYCNFTSNRPWALVMHARLRRVRRRLIGRRAQKPFATTSMHCHLRQVPFRESSSEISRKTLSFFAPRPRWATARQGRSSPKTCALRVGQARYESSRDNAQVRP